MAGLWVRCASSKLSLIPDTRRAVPAVPASAAFNVARQGRGHATFNE